MPSLSASARRTPFLLVTGFLGSGKTTLINRWLTVQRVQPLPRLGVVVNEFGQVGIDGALLGLSSGGVLEFANGCVCCVKGTELWESAVDLIERTQAEVMLVETSGLVEPAALLEPFELLPPRLKDRIDLRGLLCVVDARALPQVLSLRAEVRHQIELADRLLLTKLDLVDAATLAQVHALLDTLGARADRAGAALSTPPATLGDLLRWALSPTPPAPKPPTLPHAHPPGEPCRGGLHEGKQLVSVSVQLPGPLLAPPLLRLLAELPGTVLRAKGIVQVHGAPWQVPQASDPDPVWAAVHLAAGRVELLPLPASPTATLSSLVFIGEDLDEAWLRVRLSACSVPTAAAQPEQNTPALSR